MAYCRIPGPIQSGLQIWSLEDGTLARFQNFAPGPVCAGSDLYPTLAAVAAQFSADPDVGYLFNSCRNPERGISDAAYTAAAIALKAEVAAVRAVAEVETKRGAFDDMGRPTILFERHYLHRLTGGRYSKKHPRISQASSGGYGTFSSQYPKLYEAYLLDQNAALKSASWGRFQIMGANFLDAGYTSVKRMVDAFARSEQSHLNAFVKFIIASPVLSKAIRDKDWTTFAKSYNGPGYKKNDYDKKMKAEYERLVRSAAPK
jgi:hypothetical protein